MCELINNMIDAKDKLKNEVINGFRDNFGKCYVRLYNPIDPTEIVCELVKRFLDKNIGNKVFIAVDTYRTRQLINNRFKEIGLNTDSIKILSVDYVNTKYANKYELVVTVGLNTQLDIIRHFKQNSHFIFTIITKNEMDVEFNTGLDNILPIVKTNVTSEQIRNNNVYSPVEEYHYGVSISKDDREQYDKYTEYITTSITIFNNLENIDKCRRGDIQLGLSAAEIRSMIANNNGWSETLDTTIEFNKRIDDIYNPNSLFERANTVYNIMSQRRNLVTDNDAKLPIIKDIILENENKKIVILSKRGEYAAKITKYLNENNIVCGDYHDNIENAIAVDDNNMPILVKSGVNKGKPRIIGAQAISTINLNKFNSNMINILSIKNSSNNKLNCDIDILIITSPLCDDIYDIKHRFSELNFLTVPNIVYKVYCDNTVEHSKTLNTKVSQLKNIINKTENNVYYDENSGDIIL